MPSDILREILKNPDMVRAVLRRVRHEQLIKEAVEVIRAAHKLARRRPTRATLMACAQTQESLARRGLKEATPRELVSVIRLALKPAPPA